MGEVQAANAVDHRTPISRRAREERLVVEAFPALDHLASLCERHHNLKTAADKRGEDYMAKGCNVFGRPNDADHPWNRERT
jgi:hypothetical protein